MFRAGVFGDEALGQVPLRRLSFGLLLAALACAWVPHSQATWYYGTRQVSFLPDFLSGLLALSLIAPLYARRILPYPHHSLNGVLFLLVNLSLSATFIQVAIGTGIASVSSLSIIMVAVALSWLGLRAAAVLAWLALLVLSAIGTMLTNYSWGLAGFGFVACGFCGLMLQTRFNPHQLMAELMHEYRPRRARLAAPAEVVVPRLDLAEAMS